MLTDDVDITPTGAFELSVGVDFFQDAKFPLSGIRGDLTRVGDIRVKTGFASNVELQIEGTIQNYVAINSMGPSAIPLNITGNSTNDFDDFTISTKIQAAERNSKCCRRRRKLASKCRTPTRLAAIGTNQIMFSASFCWQKKFGASRRGTARVNMMGNLGLAILSLLSTGFAKRLSPLRPRRHRPRDDNVNIVSEVNGPATLAVARATRNRTHQQFRMERRCGHLSTIRRRGCFSVLRR